ncbi:glycosyltransferase [Bacillus cytotoxicus]|uniref:Glycosyl transferase family 2 n=2 Tax=Bacillus cytotoxicus TaxID=580165 RepID=A0AAX2CDU8_9BACI|nr:MULTISPECIES: glycosyltransferase family A protein [Bacillus cereus group]ABS21262.1 glycosyl transferase family 2 [Bacillus cytotoxicus NVH 391-98]AWC30787.1 glycosyl transferase family 2 [Bacillus cytotoxicus]AWC34848.1 glycosyl transferase family 2 [Bacillus cytotoxicus]AWC38845.1 glycosyl transferase family 2 [Bacillus cytotoxicus]AWC42965.1 glycosyl transferase family 2 [Bacillus cytotoxicus]
MNALVEDPLVSILIPTYNRPYYLKLALDSALAQTYSNIEIIIGDDSTNAETETLLRQHYLPNYNNIIYIRNQSTLGQFHNDLMLLEYARGNYINFLMDDDLFHPHKIQRMMHYFSQDVKNEIALVTSYRKRINAVGNQIEDALPTFQLFPNDTILDGTALGDVMLQTSLNIIGEPTTVLFRRPFLTEPFGTLSGRQYNCSIDMASWVHLLQKGKAVYIAEALSSLRYHPGQQIHHKLLEGTEDFTHLITTARNYGFLQSTKTYRLSLRCALQWIFSSLRDETIKRIPDSHSRLSHCLQIIQQELNRTRVYE